MQTTCLQGYAAVKLLSNWQDALADGNTDNLVKDVDEAVIIYLREFQDRAREVLPVANGGLV